MSDKASTNRTWEDLEATVHEMLVIIGFFRKVEIEKVPDTKLFDAGFKLSAHKAFLGQAAAEYAYRLAFMEAEHKHAWTNAFAEAKSAAEVGEKVTDTAARNAADMEMHESGLEQIEEKRKLDILKNLRVDAGDLVTVIQSRINQIRQEKKESLSFN